jgi:hypothetical protein
MNYHISQKGIIMKINGVSVNTLSVRLNNVDDISGCIKEIRYNDNIHAPSFRLNFEDNMYNLFTSYLNNNVRFTRFNLTISYSQRNNIMKNLSITDALQDVVNADGYFFKCMKIETLDIE